MFYIVIFFFFFVSSMETHETLAQPTQTSGHTEPDLEIHNVSLTKWHTQAIAPTKSHTGNNNNSSSNAKRPKMIGTDVSDLLCVCASVCVLKTKQSTKLAAATAVAAALNN